MITHSKAMNGKKVMKDNAGISTCGLFQDSDSDSDSGFTFRGAVIR